MLCVEHITIGYGEEPILKDVSMFVGEGEIVLLRGGNGSGKSTIIKTIYGLLHPWDNLGRITFRGRDISKLPAHQMASLGIAYMPQKQNVFEDLTVLDNLKVALDHCPKPEQEFRLESIFEVFSYLKSVQKRTPFHLSGGERQILALALAIAHSPAFVLLDEPFAGMDQDNSALLLEYIARMNREKNVAFLIAEHQQHLVSDIADREYQIELGRIIS